MKRIVLVVVFAAVAACAFAQYAGSVLVGGGLNGYMNTDVFVEETWTVWTNFRIEAYGGYFLVDGFEVGPWIFLTYDRESNDSSGILNTDMEANLGLQVGYFFLMGTRLAPFVELFAAYRLGKSTDTTGGMIVAESTWSTVRAQLRVGVEYLITDSVGLNAGTYLAFSTNAGGGMPWYDLRLFFGLDAFLGPFGG